jgi:hypothetical protein
MFAMQFSMEKRIKKNWIAGYFFYPREMQLSLASGIDCFELILRLLLQFWFSNIGLTPGSPKGCFQHPQDIVLPEVTFQDFYIVLFLIFFFSLLVG